MAAGTGGAGGVISGSYRPPMPNLPNPNTPTYNQQLGVPPAGYEWDYTTDPPHLVRSVQSTTDRLKTVLSGLGLSGGSGSGGSSGSGVATSGITGFGGSGSGGVGGSSTGLQLPDFTDAENASFATAKDKVGKTSRASLEALNDELGAQGMLGSGAQVQGTRDILQSGAGELGQVARDQAVDSANRKADFAKTAYQGNIAMRGQDIQLQQGMAQLQLQKELAMQRLLESALAGLNGGGSGLVY